MALENCSIPSALLLLKSLKALVLFLIPFLLWGITSGVFIDWRFPMIWGSSPVPFLDFSSYLSLSVIWSHLDFRMNLFFVISPPPLHLPASLTLLILRSFFFFLSFSTHPLLSPSPFCSSLFPFPPFLSFLLLPLLFLTLLLLLLYSPSLSLLPFFIPPF